MSSVFTTMPGEKIKGFAGSTSTIPFYLQFVPGNVVDVVHSEESIRYVGPHSINTIIAVPHITDKTFKRKANLGEDYRYYPLFRGMNDVPTKGDPILLCTIGKVNYYLGPLNTPSNNPTWNTDPSYRPELTLINNTGKNTAKGLRGESPNFNKEKIYRRLIKFRKDDLDYGDAIRETTGDTIIEGRHGNSIRIGSRSNNPYMFFSNNRVYLNAVESLADGSLISITSDGTLAQHFGNFKSIENNEDKLNVGFTLASDVTNNEYQQNRFMGSLIKDVKGTDSDTEIVYGYSNDQILLNSKRITLNTKLDDIYLSSFNDIHIGARKNLSISTSENLIIDSEQTFLGNPTPNGESREMESMILGTTLLELLKETLAVIKTSQGICQGAPIPLADDTGSPGGVNAKITQIEQKIDQILSTKHFIEPNT